MKLWLVSFPIHLMQFIVDAPTPEEAFEKTVEVNKNIWFDDDVYDHNNYFVNKINIDMLCTVMNRKDYWRNENGVLIWGVIK